MAKTKNPMTWKQAAGAVCLLIAVPAGFLGVLFFIGSIWAGMEMKKGQSLMGDSMGLGLMFAICLFAVAGTLGPMGWGFLKSASTEHPKGRNHKILSGALRPDDPARP